jgi:exopolysaccharide production protein ExoQ
MKKLLLTAEQIFTVVSLLHYLGGPMALILSGGENEGEGHGIPSYALVQVFFFINYAISLFLLILRWRNVIYVLKRDRFNTTLIGFIVLSYFWSADPAVTIVRSIALIGSSLFGLYLATRYSRKEQLQLLAWTFGLTILFSLIFAVALPKYGVMSGIHAGKWRGMFTHKNALGKSMVLGSLIFLLLALDKGKYQFFCWCGLGSSIFMLAISQSSSAMITFLIISITFTIVNIVRLPYTLMIPTILFLSIIGLFSNLWLSSNAGSLLGSIGKDATLTGRTDLWPAVIDKIWERPWLGYGYSGFWGNSKSESVYIWRVTGWDPPNSHNGMLDILLDLGILGLSLYLLGFIIGIFKGLNCVRRNRAADAFWPVMYMMYFWFSNQTESGFLRQNEIYWLLYVVVSLSLIPSKQLIPIQSEDRPDEPEDRSLKPHSQLVHRFNQSISTLIRTNNRLGKNRQPPARKADSTIVTPMRPKKK